MSGAPQSRNDPCPCGSGLRFKHCHGAPHAAPAAAAMVPPREGSPVVPDAAEAEWRRKIALDPANPEAHFHLGNLLRKRGDGAAAAAEYRLALRAAPGHTGLLNNLGLALAMTGDAQAAEQCYRDALAVDPRQADALANLAALLFEREAFAESAASYDALFAIRADVPASVWVRRAIAQQKVGAVGAAEASFREAARRAPDDPRIHVNLGTLLTEQGRYAEADPPLSRALALAPRDAYALSMLANARQRRCLWDGLPSLFAELNRMLEDDAVPLASNVNPFTTLAMPLSPGAQLRAAQRWAAQIAPAVPVPRPERPMRTGGRLRVGFVSSDFREHPITRLAAELFERLDRDRLETFGYGLRARDDGPFGRRIAAAFDHFIDVSGEPTAAIAQRIRDDRIGVLFDLNGYTTHERSRVFALRPAPVLINWLGYPGTLGAGWFDYVLTDRVTTPPSAQAQFSERLLYLRGNLFPGDSHREVAAAAPTRAACGLPSEGFVFCCFNNHYKILPAAFDVWMRLLTQVPGSVVWLSHSEGEPVVNLRREAAARGIDPTRLVFAPRVSLPEHLARHGHANVLLDTTPYNAGTTANDALWLGLPIITCPGESMVSRMAAGQLHAIGLPELATASLADYEALALNLARNPAELEALRARLAANRQTHPLFDMAAMAEDFADCVERAEREL